MSERQSAVRWSRHYERNNRRGKQMTRRVFATIVAVGMLSAGVAADELKLIKTQRAKDLNIALLNDTGQWKPGKNAFVLEFTGPDKKPVDVGKASVSTSMPMPGMAPMLAGATLQPDGPGKYRGSISFADAGDRQVTVSWDGPAGKGSTRFTVPVR
jgi:YtkA-like